MTSAFCVPQVLLLCNKPFSSPTDCLASKLESSQLKLFVSPLRKAPYLKLSKQTRTQKGRKNSRWTFLIITTTPDTRHFHMIDRLEDVSVLQYHHEGPYDAACAERNKASQYRPVATLSDSNAEILKATPPYKIDDCLHCHHPLDGVAFYPPGVTDPEGPVLRATPKQLENCI
ncbi:hypothetical protein V8E54_009936 [Elaphomyces granulatus]